MSASPETLNLINASEKAVDELYRATKAILANTRAQIVNGGARNAGDDEWTRMPISPRRCHISGWSRSTIEAHGKAGDIRTKLVKGKRYYAGLDIRKYLAASPCPTPVG